MKIYSIEWRVNKYVSKLMLDFQPDWHINDEHVKVWTPLEGEEWLPESAAQERLKYWQGLSLSKLLEFRVVEVTQSKKS